jgi:hypothetical protein
METNEKIREQIFEIINNQLRNNDPPETKATFDRLRKQGFDDYARYIKNLKALPKEPFD